MATEQTATERGNVAQIVNRFSKADISHSTTPTVNLRKAASTTQRNAIVQFSYIAQQDDELDIKEGDEIEILEDVEEGWARGQLINPTNESHGKIGLFPTNFVTINETPLSTNFTTSSTLSKVHEEKPIKEHSTNGTSSTIIMENPTTGVEQQRNHFLPSSIKNSRRVMSAIVTPETNSTPILPNNNNNTPSIQIPNTKPKEYAKVIYKYEAANSDELSLPEDALILVLNKNCEDDGWYEGEYNGKRGLFPENFVKLIESSPSITDKFHNVTPPLLPAKPNKPIASVSATTPIATIRDIPTGNNLLSNSATDFPTTNSKPAIFSNTEERKSMIASLQNKLFPMGKLPEKPPSSHSSSITANNNIGGDKAEKTDSEEDSNKLSSLTKTRPKQNNKRPPSFNFHSNKLLEDSITTNPNSCGSTKIFWDATIKEVPLSPKSFGTSNAPIIKPKHQQQNSSSGEPLIHLKSNNNLSDYISRAEFEKYSMEINQKLEKLMNEISELKAKLSKN